MPPITSPRTNPIGEIKKNLSIKLPTHPNNNKDAANWNPIAERVSQLVF